MKDENRIKELATQFRNAIETAKNKGEFDANPPFHKFPIGCCGDASDLLAIFLSGKGIETYYVRGTFYYDDDDNSYNSTSHAWLKTGQLIIDITGDQFKHNKDLLFYDKAVYVGLADKFHTLFEIDEKRDVSKSKSLYEYEELAKGRLSHLYEVILHNLN